MSFSVPISNPVSSDSGVLRLLFGVLMLVVLESMAYQAVMSLDDQFPQLAGTVSVYRPDVFAVHQLLKSMVGAGLLWLLLFGSEFYMARSQYLREWPADFKAGPWLVHLLSLVALLAVRGTLSGIAILPPALMLAPWIAPVYALVFAGFVATALRLLAPGPFWRQYLFRSPRRLLVWCLGTLLLAGFSTYGLDPVHLERTVMPWLFHVTAHGTAGVLDWLGYRAIVNPATNVLGVYGFEVEIGAPCLGYEGATLALLVLSGYVRWHRSRLRPAAAWLVLGSKRVTNPVLAR